MAGSDWPDIYIRRTPGCLTRCLTGSHEMRYNDFDPISYLISQGLETLPFSEFLLSDKLQHEPFGVDGSATHRMLATKCLELLSRPDGLRENLCRLKYPGQPRREVDRTIIDKRLSPAFQYACRYCVTARTKRQGEPAL